MSSPRVSSADIFGLWKLSPECRKKFDFPAEHEIVVHFKDDHTFEARLPMNMDIASKDKLSVTLDHVKGKWKLDNIDNLIAFRECDKSAEMPKAAVKNTEEGYSLTLFDPDEDIGGFELVLISKKPAVKPTFDPTSTTILLTSNKKDDE